MGETHGELQVVWSASRLTTETDSCQQEQRLRRKVRVRQFMILIIKSQQYRLSSSLIPWN